MSGKKIAFTGAPGTGKTMYKTQVVSMLRSYNISIVSDDIAKKFSDLFDPKYVDYFNNSEELELSTCYQRRSQTLMAGPNDYVVSDGWAINELAITMVKMNHLQKKIQTSNSLLAANGKAIMTPEHGDLLICQAVFQVLMNQVAIEQSFWDFLYYAPIYDENNDILNEHSINPKDRLNQKEIDIAIKTLIQQLKLNVIELPVEQKEALEFLGQEKEKWTK
jgi:hypothetical protein